MAEALKENYTDFDIYTELLEQGFNNRCFFIERISSQKSQMLSSGSVEAYEYTHNFAVTCFCDDSKTQLDEIADSLYYVLSVITADRIKLRGMNKSHSYSDGAVIFTVDYKTLVTVKGEEIPEMEVLKTDVGKKD